MTHLKDVPDPFAREPDPLEHSGGAERSTMFQHGMTDHDSGVNVNILALDLANRCGWAVRRRDGRTVHGVENFTPRPDWTPGQRWQRFRSWLAAIIVEHQIGAIAFEVVIMGGTEGGGGHKSGTAGDAYGGFKALVELAADSHRLELHPVHVATVKKHWTGDGRAKKPEMVAEAAARGFRVRDDNEADALAVLHWAEAKLRGEWKPTPKKPKSKKAGAVRPKPGARTAPQPDMFGS